MIPSHARVSVSRFFFVCDQPYIIRVTQSPELFVAPQVGVQSGEAIAGIKKGAATAELTLGLYCKWRTCGDVYLAFSFQVELPRIPKLHC
jgi:hypothetical protein